MAENLTRHDIEEEILSFSRNARRIDDLIGSLSIRDVKEIKKEICTRLAYSINVDRGFSKGILAHFRSVCENVIDQKNRTSFDTQDQECQ